MATKCIDQIATPSDKRRAGEQQAALRARGAPHLHREAQADIGALDRHDQ